MLLSASSVFALPLSAEETEAATASEAVTTVPEATPIISEETAAVPESTTAPEEAAKPVPEVTEPEVTTSVPETTEPEVITPAPEVTAPAEDDEMEVPTEQPAGDADDGAELDIAFGETVLIGQEIDNDALFEQYVNSMLYGSRDIMPLASDWGRAQLSGDALKLYDNLRPHLIAIAAGNEKTSVISLSRGTIVNSGIYDQVISALYTDIPSDMYWMDLYNKGTGWSWDSYNNYTITFSIADGYHNGKKDSRGRYIEMDTTKIANVKAALENARRIAANATGSDKDKARYFCEQITGLADYDRAAANTQNASDLGPWNLVYVFDGDPNTNVVCQGFAASFQYLCELGGIECYAVTGKLDDVNHMWNMARLDSKMYIIDVTAIEGIYTFDTYLYGYQLEGNAYRVKLNKYVYDQETLNVYPQSVLIPSKPNGEIINTGVFGAEGDGSSIEWKLDDYGNLTITGKGDMKDSESGGYTDWRDDIYKNLIKNVTIGEGITSVGAYAFDACESLKSVSLPESIITIGKSAFSKCPALIDIKIPSKVTSIGENAFWYCESLKAIIIPISVTTMGWNAFADMPALAEIHCEASKRPSGWNSNWNRTSAKVYWAGESLIDSGYCGGEEGGANLIWALGNDGILTISGTGKMVSYDMDSDYPWYANSDKIKGLRLNEGITSIGHCAFEGLNVNGVTIPSTVTVVEERAFDFSDGVKSITIPATVTSVGKNAFAMYELETIYCEASMPTKDWNPFWHNTFPTPPKIYWNGVQKLGCGYCGGDGDGTNLIWELSTDGTLTITGSGTMGFGDNGVPWSAMGIINTITDVVIGEGITSIRSGAFGSCSNLVNVTIPNTLTSIGGNAFYGTGIKNITIPDSVTEIKEGAFSNCKSMETITIPASVVEMEIGVFNNAGLKQIYCETAMPPIGWDIDWCGLSSYPVPPAIYWNGVPKIACGYCGGEGDGTNLIWEIDNTGTLTISGNGAMKDYSGSGYDRAPWIRLKDLFTKINIGDGVTVIGNHAFDNCFDVTDITISNTVTSIGENAFSNCNSVKNISIPESVTTIGKDAFAYCSGITTLIIPNGVTTIGDNAFFNMSGLTRAYISKSVEKVGMSLFLSCYSLTDIYFESETPPDGWKFYNTPDATVHFGEPLPEYIPGDVNNDFKVNNQDAIYLLKYIMSPGQFTINQSGDMNGDGKTNNQDAIYLLKFILDSEKFPLHNN